MELTDKQLNFFRKLSIHQGTKDSIRNIGREYFETDRSIYLVLNKLEKKGFIILEKGKKQLIVTLTKQGQQYLIDTYLLPQSL